MYFFRSRTVVIGTKKIITIIGVILENTMRKVKKILVLKRDNILFSISDVFVKEAINFFPFVGL